jgi:DNA topoisomerase-1
MATAIPITPESPFTARRVKPPLPPHPCTVAEPGAAANAAGLRYVTDAEPGIRRRRVGRSFSYTGPDGSPVRDRRVLARIKALAIPPAWRSVWICPRADGHLQATGRDERGRKQYRYHPRWREVRDETKYGRMLEFGRALPALRQRVDADLARAGLPREKVLAAVVQLLERTLIRIGNEEYARANDSFGLTTMHDDHVTFTGGSLRFSFRGKSGKEHRLGLHDRRLARIVRRCRDLPGQHLFQYLDEQGEQHAIGSGDVNDYLRELTGRDFTAKDFRTWFGTVLAAHCLLDAEPAATEREGKAQIARAIETVSERLGNTPAVCRRCYVHPLVLDAYTNGDLRSAAAETGKADRRSADEALVLLLLERAGPTR